VASLILRRVYNNCGIFKSAGETAGKMKVADVNLFCRAMKMVEINGKLKSLV
jgi:hypothetical protein